MRKQPIEQSSQVLDSYNGEGDDWRFHCPVSIIFGLRDVALDPRIVLDGIESHFMAESANAASSFDIPETRIMRLRSCGHWSLLEDDGSKALDKALSRIIV